MNDQTDTSRALFLGADGNIYPDTLICSGVLSAVLDGKSCPFSDGGRFPAPFPLDPAEPAYTLHKGRPGELCPPCVKQQFGNPGHWQGHGGQQFPEHLLHLRLFKCRQWLWVVVPGPADDDPTKLTGNTP